MQNEEPFCCAVDVVQRPLPYVRSVNFPGVREDLLRLAKSDQQARLTPEQPRSGITEHEWLGEDQDRVRQLDKLLEIVSYPSCANVGYDGARAVWLIALHGGIYMDISYRVLAKMLNIFIVDRELAFPPGIPFLIDNVLLANAGWAARASQLFGTVAGLKVYRPNGQVSWKHYATRDVSNLSERRRAYGLSNMATCRHLNGS